MDKLYKTPWTEAARRAMAEALPPFVPFKVPKGAEGADTLAGAAVYRLGLEHGRAAWIVWVPGPGVERRFSVLLGWSTVAGQLPYDPGADARRFSATAPIDGVAGRVLNLEQVEGRSAIGGIEIPSPWDRVAALKPTVPRVVEREVVEAAAGVAAALTDEDRRAAVERVVRDVMRRLEARVPAFVSAVRAWQP